MALNEEVICPHCGKPTYDDDAILCHFCGESLKRPGNTVLGNMKYGKMQLLWIALALLVVIAFIMIQI